MINQFIISHYPTLLCQLGPVILPFCSPQWCWQSPGRRGTLSMHGYAWPNIRYSDIQNIFFSSSWALPSWNLMPPNHELRDHQHWELLPSFPVQGLIMPRGCSWQKCGLSPPQSVSKLCSRTLMYGQTSWVEFVWSSSCKIFINIE